MEHPAPTAIRPTEAMKGSEAQPGPKQHAAARHLTMHCLLDRVDCPKPWGAGEAIPRDRQFQSHDKSLSLLRRDFPARYSLSEFYRRGRCPALRNRLLFEDIRVAILECRFRRY